METRKGTSGGSESEPEYLLQVCTDLLALRDFGGCREFSLRIPRSDPNISGCVDQILAIAEVLDAASRRLSNNNFNWYAVLQLRRDAACNRELVRLQFKKFIRLLDPNKNKYPFSDEALMRVREAWFVLSVPARRAEYEREIGKPQPPEPCEQSGGDHAPNIGINENVGYSDATFWTLCPYCWYMHEYEKKHEDFTLRCWNCRKTFHGTAVEPPAADMVVEGKQQYYCYHMSLALRYLVSEPVEKETGMEDMNMGEQHFAYNVHDFSKECGIGECEQGFQGNAREEEVQGNGRTDFQGNGKRRRFKTVANRKRSQVCVDPNSDSDFDAEDADLEFTEGDGDIFVGFTK